MIWMDVDAALIEIPVNVNPLVDAATAKVVDEGVTYDEAGMDLVWHFTTTAGVNSATDVTPTTGGDYNWQHQGAGMYTIAMTASGGASANNDTEGFGYFTGNTTANLPFRGPTIGFRAAALNNALIDGGDNLDVSLTHVMGTILTEGGAGRLAAALIKLLDVATPVLTATSVNQTGDAFAAIGTVPALDGAAQTVGAAIAKLADDNGGADFDATTDSLQAVRDRGDAAWTTGAGGSDRLLMVDTTIVELASQTSFRLTAGSADDDAYNNCTIVIEDSSTATQKAVGLVSAYTGATKTVTLKYDPGVFAMEATDKVYILAENALKTTVANRQIDVDANGRVDVGEWLGTAVTLSTGNKPDVNVDEWHDVLLATTNPLPNAVAGASTGLLISGSNAGTTTFGALTVTGITTLTGNVALSGTLGVAGVVTYTSGLVADITGTVSGAVGGVSGLTIANGAADSNLTYIGGNSIAGNLATLTLKQLDVQNGEGDAVYFAATGLSGYGLHATSPLGTPGIVSDITGNITGNITGDLVGTVSTVTTNTDMRGTDSAATAAVLGAAVGASISADIAAVKAETASIVADTADLQGNQSAWLTATGFAEAGDAMDLVDDAIDANSLPSSTLTLIVDAILNEATADHAEADSVGKAIIDVLADTNELQTDWANGGRLDLIQDIIVADTTTDIPALIATAQADLDIITGADGVFLATASQPAGWPANLAASAGQVIKATVDTVTNTHTPLVTQFQADDITEATADHYNGRIVIFTSGNLAGQATDITDYEAVGGIGQITVTALTEAPANNDTFVIV